MKKCNKHNSCRIEMPKRFEKILKYNPGEKPLSAPFAINLDLECLLKKEKSSQNNPEKWYAEKKPGISLQTEQCLQDVHLIHQKINSIITEEGIA